MKEFFNVFTETYLVIKRLGVAHFIVVELQQQLVGVIFDFLLTRWCRFRHCLLEFIADVVAVYRFVAND